MNKRKLTYYSIGGLFLIVLLVTLFNALTVNSRQPTPHPTEFALNEDKAVEHLSKAITYKTISFEFVAPESKWDTPFGRYPICLY